MIFKKSLVVLLLAIMPTLLIASCSGGSEKSTSLITGDTIPDSLGISSQNEKNMLAVYNAVINPVDETFSIEPAERIVGFHYPLSNLYPDVLQITWFDFGPPFEADIKLQHPLPDSGVDAFDARVIAVLPANDGVSMEYPDLNVTANNSVLLYPDGYTKLWDRELPGNTNPFVAYFKNEPNRVWSSTDKTEETQRWSMDLNGFGGPLQFYLIVDISTNYPQPPQPVVDNCPEPAEIIYVNVGSGLVPEGGSANVDVAILDWQGTDNVAVRLEIPGVTNEILSFSYSEPGEPDIYVFSGIIENSLAAPAGDYVFLVEATDTVRNLSIYKEFNLTISEPVEGTWSLDTARGNVDTTKFDFPMAPGSDIAVINGDNEEVNGFIAYDQFHQVIKSDLQLTNSDYYGSAILPSDQNPENPHPNPTEPMQAGRIAGADNGQVIRTFIDDHVGLGPAANGLYQRCDCLVYIQHPRDGELRWTVSYFVGTDNNPNTEVDESEEKVRAFEVWSEADDGQLKFSLGNFWTGTLLFDETNTYNLVGVYGALKDPYYDYVDLYYDWGLYMSTGAAFSEMVASDSSMDPIFPYHYRGYSGPTYGPATVYWHYKAPPDYIDSYLASNTNANLLDLEIIPLQNPPLIVNETTQANDWVAMLLDDKTIEIFDPTYPGGNLVVIIDISEIIGEPVYMDVDNSNADIFISHTDGTIGYCSVYSFNR